MGLETWTPADDAKARPIVSAACARLYRRFRRKYPDIGCDDLTQVAMLAVSRPRTRARFDPHRSSYSTYLTNIAYRRGLDVIRRRSRISACESPRRITDEPWECDEPEPSHTEYLADWLADIADTIRRQMPRTSLRLSTPNYEPWQILCVISLASKLELSPQAALMMLANQPLLLHVLHLTRPPGAAVIERALRELAAQGYQ